jgi:hypothetical protein
MLDNHFDDEDRQTDDVKNIDVRVAITRHLSVYDTGVDKNDNKDKLVIQE